jgi:hypothetical protein
VEIKGWRSLRPSPSQSDDGKSAAQTEIEGLNIPLSTATLAMLAPGVIDDKDRATIEKMNAKDAREDQIIAAMDRRNKARQVARDRSGETAASDVVDQVWDEKYAAYTRVANTRARTLSGVLAKLALIAPDVDDDSASDFPGPSEPILFSVAVDFKALKAGEART